MPFSNIEKIINPSVTEKFFDHYLSKTLAKYPNSSDFINIISDGSSMYHNGKLSLNGYGFNKNGDERPKKNLGMLISENTLIPVYANIFTEYINDDSLFSIFTQKLAQHNLSDATVKITNDRVCYSNENIDDMLNRGIDFVMHVPKTSFKTNRADGKFFEGYSGIKRILLDETADNKLKYEKFKLFEDSELLGYSAITIKTTTLHTQLMVLTIATTLTQSFTYIFSMTYLSITIARHI